jgi:hypothetical protein
MHYHTVVLHLHRKFIVTDTVLNGSVTTQSSQQKPKSTEICNRAANAIIGIFETILSKNFLAQSPFTAIIALTAAAIHISLEIRLAIEAGATLLALSLPKFE